ncbi:hypothetical protein XI07_05085 [Bradyrhizobium sp. CCBAU 11445]|nr:hypothetical protein [Bradyrhizobium sp. CCBAU 11445]
MMHGYSYITTVVADHMAQCFTQTVEQVYERAARAPAHRRFARGSGMFVSGKETPSGGVGERSAIGC